MEADNSMNLRETSLSSPFVNIEGKSFISMFGVRLTQNQQLNMTSNNVTLEKSLIQSNLTIRIFAHDHLNVTGTNMSANLIFMKGDDGLVIQGSSIESLIQNTCNTLSPYDSNVFSCIKKSSLDTVLDESKFMKSFNQQYLELSKIKNVTDAVSYIHQNFTVYLLTYGNAVIENSNIVASKLGTCSLNLYFQ